MTAFVECEGGDLVNVAAIEAIVVAEGSTDGHLVVIVAASGNRYTYSSLILTAEHGAEVAGQLYGQILGDEQARPPTWEASQA